jgi:hypothetical protein
MLRLALIAALTVVLSIGLATAAEATTGAPRVASVATVDRAAPVLAAFRSFRFSSRSRYGYGYQYGRRSPSLLRRVVKTAIWLYVLHLFFTHGGLSILLWIIIIGFVVSFMRRRRRRYDYRPRSFWT